MNRGDFLRAVMALVEEGKVCCICGEPIEGWGNNPYPCVRMENARCCDACNFKYVIPARIAKFEHEE